MPRLELNQTERTSSLGLWVKTRDGGYRCGNVKVKAGPEEGHDWPVWRIYVWSPYYREWQIYHHKTRSHGYGHQGQAKIGAALAMRWQRMKP